MKRLALVLGACLFASIPLASAQSLSGVSLGDAAAKVMRALPGATNVPINDNPKHRLIFQGETMVFVCNDAVYSVERQVGVTLTEYLSLVDSETARRGAPVVSSKIETTPAGTISWTQSDWPNRDSWVGIQFKFNGTGHYVFSTVNRDSKC